METNLNSSLFSELSITDQESLSGGDGYKKEYDKKEEYDKKKYDFKFEYDFKGEYDKKYESDKKYEYGFKKYKP